MKMQSLQFLFFIFYAEKIMTMDNLTQNIVKKIAVVKIRLKPLLDCGSSLKNNIRIVNQEVMKTTQTKNFVTNLNSSINMAKI